MPHSDTLVNALEFTADELAGQWVAVHNGGDSSTAGAVVVDHDTELDLLCQRVAAAGQSGLTIYLYQGQFPAHYADQEHYLKQGHWPGPRGNA